MPDGDRVQNGNIALLIDADNASAGGLDQTLTILAELGTVNRSEDTRLNSSHSRRSRMPSSA